MILYLMFYIDNANLNIFENIKIYSLTLRLRYIHIVYILLSLAKLFELFGRIITRKLQRIIIVRYRFGYDHGWVR